MSTPVDSTLSTTMVLEYDLFSMHMFFTESMETGKDYMKLLEENDLLEKWQALTASPYVKPTSIPLPDHVGYH